MTNITKNSRSFLIGAFLATIALFIFAGANQTLSSSESGQRNLLRGPAQWFGQSYDTGKTPATPGEQPWMVALVDAGTEDAYDGQFCGGSLIRYDLVLTAAHCLVDYNNANEIDVVIGRHVLSSSEGERINAAEVYIHAGYDDYSDGEDNDIAVIRLEQSSKLGTPIRLIDSSNAYVDDPGTIARATGWGILTDDSQNAPDVLHGVDIPVISQAVCQSVYGEELLPDTVCAGLAEGGKDTCSGDSGGPLVAPDKQGNPVQIGVVSWGDVCGAPESYGVYARITAYEGWIDSIENGTLQASDLTQFEGESEWGDGIWGWFEDSDDYSEENWDGWEYTDDDEWNEWPEDDEGEWWYDETDDEWWYDDSE